MGAWGFNLYENDKSCDVKDEFVYLLRDNPEMVSWDVLEKKLFPAFEDQMHNINVVLALADLSITFAKLKPELLDTALGLIKEEMDNINQWREPEKRKAFLIDFESYLKTTVTNK